MLRFDEIMWYHVHYPIPPLPFHFSGKLRRPCTRPLQRGLANLPEALAIKGGQVTSFFGRDTIPDVETQRGLGH